MANGTIELHEETNFIDIWKSKTGTIKYSTDGGSTWNDPGTNNASLYTFNSNVKIDASGIKLKFDTETYFGFYLKIIDSSKDGTGVATLGLDESTSHNDYNHIYFSHSTLNNYYGRIMKDGSGNYYIRDQITETITDGSNGGAGTISYSATNGGAALTADDSSFNTNGWQMLSSSNNKGFWNSEKAIHHSYSTAAYLNNIDVYDSSSNYIRTQSYFCFEDWYFDSDLQDLIFIVKDLNLEVYDDEGKIEGGEEDEDTPYEWLICAEDLGTTDDFDFNDMIVKVETLTNGDGGEGTYTWAKFTAMAAGGTLPLYLYFDPTKIYNTTDEDKQSSITSSGLMYPDGKGDSFAEFHQWFGTSGYQFSEMINTSGSSGVGGRYCTLYIDGIFSLYADATSKTNQQVTESNTLASFWIEVENSSAGDDEKQIIKPKFRSEEQGSEFNSYAPQMFVIPYSWQKASDTTPTYYRWPIERKNISDAYNTTGYTFKSWVEADLVSTSTWYRYPVDGTTCRPWAGEIAPE